jgi:hypothetical protein
MRHKAELMGLNASVIEDTLIQQQSIADIRRKWNIPPAFTYGRTSSIWQKERKTPK